MIFPRQLLHIEETFFYKIFWVLLLPLLSLLKRILPFPINVEIENNSLFCQCQQKILRQCKNTSGKMLMKTDMGLNMNSYTPFSPDSRTRGGWLLPKNMKCIPHWEALPDGETASEMVSQCPVELRAFHNQTQTPLSPNSHEDFRLSLDPSQRT